MNLELEQLSENLQSEDFNIRQEACYLLGKLETVEAANLLQQATCDRDPRVRQLASQSLAHLNLLGISPSQPIKKSKISLRPAGFSRKSKTPLKPVVATAKRTLQKSPPKPKPLPPKKDTRPAPPKPPVTPPPGNIKKEPQPTDWRSLLANPENPDFPVAFAFLNRQEKLEFLSAMEASAPDPVWERPLRILLDQEQDAFALSKLIKVYSLVAIPGRKHWIGAFLAHEDERVVANALEVLASSAHQCDPLKVIPFLVHTTPRVRGNAIRILWSSKPKEAWRSVVDMARSPRIWDREAARYALETCPLPEGKVLAEEIALTDKLLHDDYNVRLEACYLLGKLETVHAANVTQSALADVDPRVRQLAQKTLDRLDMLGIKPDIPAPKKVLKLSKRRKPQENKPPLPTPSKGTQRQRKPVLPRNNKTPQKPVSEPKTIWQKMLEAPDQKAFAKWLIQKKRSEKIKILEAIEKHPACSRWSAYLKDALDQEVDPFSISKLLKVLAHHHGKGAVTLLEPYLEHKNERVVANAIEALALSGGTRDFSRILSFLDHPDARVKANAARIIWETHPAAALKAISAMARSGKVWEKDAARHALGFCPLDEGKKLLESLGQTSVPVTSEAPFLSKIKLPEALSSRLPASWTKGLPKEWVAFLNKMLSWLSLILQYPLHVGTDEPQPVWIMLSIVAMCLFLFFFVFIPFFEWLIPGPPMWG